MSLNKLLQEGKVSDGLDVKVKSISDSSTGLSVFNGQVNFVGSLKQNSKIINMSTTQLYASYNIQSSEVNNFASIPFYYQKYGDVLHISGVVVCDIINTTSSKLIECRFNLPNGYTLSPAVANGRYFSVSGGGVYSTGVGTSEAVWIASQATVLNATTYAIRWNTGTGKNALLFNGQLVLSFSVFLDGVVTGVIG